MSSSNQKKSSLSKEDEIIVDDSPLDTTDFSNEVFAQTRRIFNEEELRGLRRQACLISNNPQFTILEAERVFKFVEDRKAELLGDETSNQDEAHVKSPPKGPHISVECGERLERRLLESLEEIFKGKSPQLFIPAN